MSSVKVAVTGAAGQLAYAFLFRLAAGEVFGREVAIDLRLLEVDAALTRARGVQMELEDCAFPLLQNVICTSDVCDAMQNIDWAVLIGAFPRKPGMERADLLSANAGIFREQGQALNAYALPHARVLVVGNPCNTNCLVALHYAPRLNPRHFYAMTKLDELRAKFKLAQKAAVASRLVTDLVVWGNHSATQYPDFYHAKIDGKHCTSVISPSWLQRDFIQQVKERGTEILQARGVSSGASASNAIVESVKDILFDTKQMYSLACCSHGEYGIDQGLVFSYPCITQQGEVKILTTIEHNDFGKQQLEATLLELQKERATVKYLGFL